MRVDTIILTRCIGLFDVVLPTTVISWVIVVWVAAVMGMVGHQLLNGQIVTTGLLRSSVTGVIDPERIQLLIGTIAGAAYYAATALQQLANAESGLSSLPDVPDTVLMLLAGSQTLYVGGKLTRRIASSSTPVSREEGKSDNDTR